MIPLLGVPPLRDPALIDQPAQTHPLAPKISAPLAGSWQRWLAQLFRAVAALTGNLKDPVFTFEDIEYRWLGALRISVPQKALAALAKILGPEDRGLMVHVADYGHFLEWQGGTYFWALGEPGSGMLVEFLITPDQIGWVACDGSIDIPILNADGTLSLVTVPDVVNTFLRQ